MCVGHFEICRRYQLFPWWINTMRLSPYCLWKSTQNIIAIHWEIPFSFSLDNLRALRFQSWYTILKCPLGHIYWEAFPFTPVTERQQCDFFMVAKASKSVKGRLIVETICLSVHEIHVYSVLFAIWFTCLISWTYIYSVRLVIIRAQRPPKNYKTCSIHIGVQFVGRICKWTPMLSVYTQMVITWFYAANRFLSWKYLIMNLFVGYEDLGQW